MSSIPNHRVECCRNVHSRLGIFDKLMTCGIFAGGHEATRERLKTLPKGDFLLREYDFYAEGAACCTCFWMLLHNNLGAWSGTPEVTTTPHYVEIETSCEELEDEQCLKRLLKKQKSHPVMGYAYVIDQQDGGRCTVRLLYRTDNNHQLKKQLLERIFPEGAEIRNNHKITNLDRRALLDNENCVKHEMN